MKVNNYIKFLSSVLIVLGYGSDSYSAQLNSNTNTIFNDDNDIDSSNNSKHKSNITSQNKNNTRVFLHRKNQLTKSQINEIELSKSNKIKEFTKKYKIIKSISINK